MGRRISRKPSWMRMSTRWMPCWGGLLPEVGTTTSTKINFFLRYHQYFVWDGRKCLKWSLLPPNQWWIQHYFTGWKAWVQQERIIILELIKTNKQTNKQNNENKIHQGGGDSFTMFILELTKSNKQTNKQNNENKITREGGLIYHVHGLFFLKDFEKWGQMP